MKIILPIILSVFIFTGCRNKELPSKQLSNVTVVRTQDNSQPAEAENDNPSNTNVNVSPNTPTNKVSGETISSSGKFHIIVASFDPSKKAEASRRVIQLKEKGHPATLLISTERYRVSIESFTTEEKAKAELPKYRKITGQPDVWVYEAR